MDPLATSPAAVHVIGGGLAGSEAAWQVARAGFDVVLHEMRPGRTTPAHKTDWLGELVCSNSLRSDDSDMNAVGLLHDELRRAGSLIMRAADAHKVPAGGALAVDRDAFAQTITKALLENPHIRIVREEILSLDSMKDPDGTPWPCVIVASGPLTSDALAASILEATATGQLHFFDAIAPIVTRESIDMSKAWFQSRYDKEGPAGTGSDYINCAMDKGEYEAFVEALLSAPKTEFKDWEKDTPYFEGCLPVEVMASRGPETLRFGPMKPVGLTNPHKAEKSYAVVQLRQDNDLATLYNLVGFQTKMKHAEQLRVFRMIPGLENASFARLGGMHRNTFIQSPLLLDPFLRLKARPALRFAGQIIGVEGYVESTAMGLLAGLFAVAELAGHPLTSPPPTTALGALARHITGSASAETFQPMNVTFGLFPPLEEPLEDAQSGKKRKKEAGRSRKAALSARAKVDFGAWFGSFLAAPTIPL